MCLLMCNSCYVECINKVIESFTLLNKCGFVFAVTVEVLQVWWKRVRTRFGKLTGHCLGDGACELTGHDKYILEKLQFLETCSVSIKFIHHQICHYISRYAMCKCNFQYEYFLNAIKMC